MEDTASYDGYVIQSAPRHLAESGRWTLHIYIWRDTGDNLSGREFYSKDIFSTREEAIKHGFNFGRQIIDGQVEGCSVNDV